VYIETGSDGKPKRKKPMLSKLLESGETHQGKSNPPQSGFLGEAVVRAKATADDADVRRTWVLLGDPAMTISSRIRLRCDPQDLV
jgi:hypothetical protein